MKKLTLLFIGLLGLFSLNACSESNQSEPETESYFERGALRIAVKDTNGNDLLKEKSFEKQVKFLSEFGVNRKFKLVKENGLNYIDIFPYPYRKNKRLVKDEKDLKKYEWQGKFFLKIGKDKKGIKTEYSSTHPLQNGEIILATSPIVLESVSFDNVPLEAEANKDHLFKITLIVDKNRNIISAE